MTATLTYSPAPMSPDTLMTVLVKLLGEATSVLDRAPEIAARHIRQALELLRYRATAPAPVEPVAPPQAKGGLAPWQMTKVKDHISANLAGRLNDTVLADLVRLSVGHFSRAFKASVGMSPHTYIVNRRVEASKDLMAAGDASLAQIAVACGLTDQAHLCHVFRRQVGLTPAVWRRRHRSEADGGERLTSSIVPA